MNWNETKVRREIVILANDRILTFWWVRRGRICVLDKRDRESVSYTEGVSLDQLL